MRTYHRCVIVGRRFAEFALAYILFIFETVAQAPLYFFISLTLLLSIVGTLLRPDPFFWQKIALGVQKYSISTIENALRVAQDNGDPILAKNLYLHSVSFDQNRRLYAVAFPHEKLKEMRMFWGDIREKQPTSREAIAALAIIEYSAKQEELFATRVHEWKIIEPNDKRITSLLFSTRSSSPYQQQ
ncbi:MAG: hypothetical protein HZA34_02935 [Candidatus Pacebacteria bacterium]|nr:hypothetical protein [Candidatus Paceibacterota bacterium]